MTSAIDPAIPPAIAPTTAGVRANFLAAKNEIEALQALAILAEQRTDDLGSRYDTAEIAGQMMCPQAAAGVTVSTAALAAGAQRFYPFLSPKSGTLNSYMLNVTVVGAGNMRMGIYAESETYPGMPGAILDASPELSQNALGILLQPCAIPVTKGQRLFLVHHSAIAATYTSLTALQMPVPYPPAVASFTVGRNMGSFTTAYAALPASLDGTAWTLALSTAPLVGITIS